MITLRQHNGVLVRSEHYASDAAAVDEVVTLDGYHLQDIGFASLLSPVVVDVGAHIGSFAALCHYLNPSAQIACVEVCPENIPVLCANAGEFATIFQAACVYGDQPLMLLNTIQAKTVGASGGSRLAPREHAEGMARLYQNSDGEPFYATDDRPFLRITVEEALQSLGADHIDVLKVDCEGSEFNVLLGCDVSRVRVIVGEYHDHALWSEFVAERFAGWQYTELSDRGDGPLGTFRLINPDFAA